MRQIRCLNSEEIVGKTIKATLFSDDSLALIFTDGEIFQVNSHGDEDNTYVDDMTWFEPDYFNTEDLANVLLDNALVMEYVGSRRRREEEREQKAKESQERLERDQYERLKAKFEAAAT
jgi:hypothetical protein